MFSWFGCSSHISLLDVFSFWPRIMRLFQSSSPTTVARFIIAVVIWVAIQASGGWAWSHVSVEQFKTVPPSVAHGDTPTTIILPCGTLRIEASLLSAQPGKILATAVSSMSVCSCREALPASTTCNVTAPKFEAFGDFISSAILAHTKPLSLPIRSIFGACENDQIAKPESGDVLKNRCRLMATTATTLTASGAQTSGSNGALVSTFAFAEPINALPATFCATKNCPATEVLTNNIAATATLSCSRFKIRCTNNPLFSAATLTKELSLPAVLSGTFQYGPVAKLLTSKIESVSHSVFNNSTKFSLLAIATLRILVF